MSQSDDNPQEGNPFAAVTGSAPGDEAEGRRPFASRPPSPRGSAQFSLKMLFGITGGLAALLAILTALRIDTANIVAAFLGTGMAAFLAIVLVSLSWSVTGRPRRRR